MNHVARHVSLFSAVMAACLACASNRAQVYSDNAVDVPSSDLVRPCKEPDCVPPIPSETVDGDDLDENLLQGRVVLVIFYTTYCNACLDLFPSLQELNARYAGKPVVMLGVLQDSTADTAQALAARERADVGFPQVRFTPRMARATGSEGILPLLALYGADGHLVQRWSGAIDLGAVSSMVDGLLAALR